MLPHRGPDAIDRRKIALFTNVARGGDPAVDADSIYEIPMLHAEGLTIVCEKLGIDPPPDRPDRLAPARRRAQGASGPR